MSDFQKEIHDLKERVKALPDQLHWDKEKTISELKKINKLLSELISTAETKGEAHTTNTSQAHSNLSNPEELFKELQKPCYIHIGLGCGARGYVPYPHTKQDLNFYPNKISDADLDRLIIQTDPHYYELRKKDEYALIVYGKSCGLLSWFKGYIIKTCHYGYANDGRNTALSYSILIPEEKIKDVVSYIEKNPIILLHLYYYLFPEFKRAPDETIKSQLQGYIKNNKITILLLE